MEVRFLYFTGINKIQRPSYQDNLYIYIYMYNIIHRELLKKLCRDIPQNTVTTTMRNSKSAQVNTYKDQKKKTETKKGGRDKQKTKEKRHQA